MTHDPTVANDAVRKLAEKSDLESLIYKLAKVGNLNHISLSVDGKDDRSFVAIFRDTIGHAPYRYMSGRDPVLTLKLALASIVAVQGADIARVKAEPVPFAKRKASRKADDEDDFI